ncbi:hypothetical protein [Streptomyces sp. NPDC058398]
MLRAPWNNRIRIHDAWGDVRDLQFDGVSGPSEIAEQDFRPWR